MRLHLHTLIPLLLLCSTYTEQTSGNASKSGTQLSEVSPVLLVSTLNGQLSAVSKSTGNILWSRYEDPVIKVPPSGASSVFLPDPKDGSLYIIVSPENTNSGEPRQPSIKKLPFTIPELVSASPCRSSDGMLYTGQKLDVWLAIDLATGEKKETISLYGSDNVCPQSKSGVAYIGRSEYHLAMFDATSKEKRWNATYYDYASTAANVPEVVNADYDVVHFASSEIGKIISFDKSSGEFLWEANFESPIVALYLVDDAPDSQSTLMRLPFTSLAQRTIDDIGSSRLLRKNWEKYMSTDSNENPLFPALYIGVDSTRQELYALPSFVDKTVPLIPTDGNARNIPLLEGPKTNGGRRREIYEGYYELPEPVITSLAPRRQITGSSVILPIGQGSVIEIPRKDASTQADRVHDGTSTADAIFQQRVVDQLYWIKVGLLTLGVVFIVTVLWFYFHSTKQTQSSSRTLNLRISGETGQPVRELEISENGICTVGKISYDANNKLGSGGNGTVVFRGHFDGRPVAVKRILPVCYSLAFREVKLLRETDEHPNVVRYFCMEEDSHFYYIALELCAATLTEFVENPDFERCNLDPLKAIHQAASGLEHLHSLNIAHRDIKPQNVLISRASTSGYLKVMISDFGLCKEITQGDRSFSKKSGVLGTEGWIAPEVLEGTASSRVTKAIDIFSLGCVFHYALSGGYHPFGDSFERQANIRKGKSNLSNLDSRYITAKGLIHQMLHADSRQRPTVSQVTRHPAFWHSSRTLNFIQEVSDRIEKESHTSPIVRQLERNGFKVLNNKNWLDQITIHLQTDLKRFRSYKGTCVRDLLRAIRNKKHHYRELPPELQADLGSIPDEYVNYFTSRFPYLILHTYSAMQPFRHDAPLLRTYYGPDEDLIDLNPHPDLDLMVAPDNSWEIWRSNRMQKQLDINKGDAMIDSCLPEEDIVGPVDTAVPTALQEGDATLDEDQLAAASFVQQENPIPAKKKKHKKKSTNRTE